jgi:hypothetical protein
MVLGVLQQDTFVEARSARRMRDETGNVNLGQPGEGQGFERAVLTASPGR